MPPQGNPEMIDFKELPKQWLVTGNDPGAIAGGRRDTFCGWHVAAAESVPILRLCYPDGGEFGRLIGWVIEGGALHLQDATLHLAPDETAEAFFTRLAGRFVMLWRDPAGNVRLREDASGGLPAIYAPGARMVGATTTLIDQFHALPDDEDVEDIFSFPSRRGFLPFGVTPKQGAYRLMPSHELALGDFSAARIWPETPLVRIGPGEVPDQARKVASILREQVTAILAQGPASLLLSGGRDSRAILAAARGRTGNLRAETLGSSQVRDVFLARKVARLAGVAHRHISILPCPDQDLTDWLDRSGRMMFDPVSRLGPTVRANDTGAISMSGTGAEIMRASNWEPGDIHSEKLGISRLLGQIRMPDHPRIREAASAWLNELCDVDTPHALDLAKIEQIHGCWSGSAVYGHIQERPSILPFSGRRLYNLSLAVPLKNRLDGSFQAAVLHALWPDLGRIPANRAQGVARLRFWREELRDIVPDEVKRMIKPLR